MRKAGLVLSAAVALLLTACGTGADAPAPTEALRQHTSYFNLPAFLNEQSTALNRRKPAIEKQVLLRDGGQETKRLTPTDWAKELQIFQQADIDKPALRGQYLVDSLVTPDGLLLRTYRRRPGVKHPVRQLAVVSRAGQVQQVRATVAQDNPLVYSSKTLELDSPNGQLRTYRVQGVQKLILFDSVRYAVKGVVSE
ncbi:hypothetical protein [Hymenobacter psychrophilus]|uniref:Uncharacterized protein n=1 Tax=Hymenobacter psychrophilus TaxID=651662 RepID=A0A1H3I6Q4_9BACT|nr:hypothetical protein [Hymenobacter psychrophilus]SDY22654.1 hypothetical protein SAMN04488069_106287 [Hymenobacter psychrophilus]